MDQRALVDLGELLLARAVDEVDVVVRGFNTSSPIVAMMGMRCTYDGEGDTGAIERFDQPELVLEGVDAARVDHTAPRGGFVRKREDALVRAIRNDMRRRRDPEFLPDCVCLAIAVRKKQVG